MKNLLLLEMKANMVIMKHRYSIQVILKAVQKYIRFNFDKIPGQ